VKVIPVQTYALLVEDAVQLRVMEQMVTELTQRISDMEQIQAQIEANLTRQIAILTAENQARETISDNWERSYGVVKKELAKKQKGNKWLKVAVGLSFLVGLFIGQ
jgi:biopolymer transport protein ExbB/TolQ